MWAVVSLWPPLSVFWLRHCVCRRELRRSRGESAAVGALVCDPEPPDILRPPGKSCRRLHVGVSDQNCMQAEGGQAPRPVQQFVCGAESLHGRRRCRDSALQRDATFSQVHKKGQNGHLWQAVLPTLPRHGESLSDSKTVLVDYSVMCTFMHVPSLKNVCILFVIDRPLCPTTFHNAWWDTLARLKRA